MQSGRCHQLQPPNQYMKKCYLEHDWQQFTVTFSVSWPIDYPLSNVQFIDKEDSKEIMMTKQKSVMWMQSKYGDNSTPYEITIKMPNTEGGVNGVW